MVKHRSQPFFYLKFISNKKRRRNSPFILPHPATPDQRPTEPEIRGRGEGDDIRNISKLKLYTKRRNSKSPGISTKFQTKMPDCILFKPSAKGGLRPPLPPRGASPRASLRLVDGFGRGGFGLRPHNRLPKPLHGAQPRNATLQVRKLGRGGGEAGRTPQILPRPAPNENGHPFFLLIYRVLGILVL